MTIQGIADTEEKVFAHYSPCSGCDGVLRNSGLDLEQDSGVVKHRRLRKQLTLWKRGLVPYLGIGIRNCFSDG